MINLGSVSADLGSVSADLGSVSADLGSRPVHRWKTSFTNLGGVSATANLGGVSADLGSRPVHRWKTSFTNLGSVSATADLGSTVSRVTTFFDLCEPAEHVARESCICALLGQLFTDETLFQKFSGGSVLIISRENHTPPVFDRDSIGVDSSGHAEPLHSSVSLALVSTNWNNWSAVRRLRTPNNYSRSTFFLNLDGGGKGGDSAQSKCDSHFSF